MKQIKRSEWRKTPYAGTTAKDTHGNITKLINKYGGRNIVFGRIDGQNGRLAAVLRFKMEGKAYRIAIESLDADAEETELIRQAERAVFNVLKSSLELSEVFRSKEKALFMFMELGDNMTVFEMPDEELAKFATSPMGFNRMLPAAPAGVIDAEVED